MILQYLDDWIILQYLPKNFGKSSTLLQCYVCKYNCTTLHRLIRIKMDNSYMGSWHKSVPWWQCKIFRCPMHFIATSQLPWYFVVHNSTLCGQCTVMWFMLVQSHNTPTTINKQGHHFPMGIDIPIPFGETPVVAKQVITSWISDYLQPESFTIRAVK